MINHTMAAAPIVDADAPVFAHGETEANPRPVPSESRISEKAAVTNAPPITAAQDTPEEYASLAGASAMVVMPLLLHFSSGTAS